MKEFKLPKNYNGCLPDPVDPRDVPLEAILTEVKIPSWEEGYSLEKEIGETVVGYQGHLGSCVGFTFSHYAEYLENIENKKFIDLSARFVYALAKAQDGYSGQGTYLRIGAKVLSDAGACERIYLEETPDLGMSHTAYIDLKEITDPVKENALTYKAKGYASIWHRENLDFIRQAIYQNKGVATGVYGSNEGWRSSDGIVRPPKDGERQWGHAILLVGWKMIGDKKYIIFKNSWSKNWGDNGFGYLPEDYFGKGFVFSLWSIVDLPNDWRDRVEKMYKIVQHPQRPGSLYAINNGARRHIANWQTYQLGGREPDKLWEFEAGVSKIPFATPQEWDLSLAPELHLDPADE